jgi:hypothetical protein
MSERVKITSIVCATIFAVHAAARRLVEKEDGRDG